MHKMQKVFLVFTLLLLVGCAIGEPVLIGDPKVDLVWPLPPNPPRIRFLKALSGPEDIVLPKGKVGRLVDVLTGDVQRTVGINTPYGVASDGETVLYVADTSAGIVHRFDLVRREVTAIVKAGDTVLASPAGLALDVDGHLYVSDSVRNQVYKFNGGGYLIETLDAPQGFRRPAGIAVNDLGEKYVVDVLAQTVYVFDKEDMFVGEFPQKEVREQLNHPTNVAVDRQHNVYVTDSMNFCVKVFDRQGRLINSIGQVGDKPGSFARPKGVATDSQGHVYVVDGSSDNFQIFDKEGHLLLYVGRKGRRPGEFQLPAGIFVDRHDRIYVADAYNHRIQVFQLVKQEVRQ